MADSKAEAVTRSGSTPTLSAVRHLDALLQLEMKALDAVRRVSKA